MQPGRTMAPESLRHCGGAPYEAQAALTSAQAAFDGCEAEAARQKDEDEMILSESSPELVLLITPLRTVDLGRDRGRRTPTTAPIEISVLVEPGFTYELQHSRDLVTWASHSTPMYAATATTLSWPITPSNGIVERKGLDETPYFRVSISPGNSTGMGRVIAR